MALTSRSVYRRLASKRVHSTHIAMRWIENLFGQRTSLPWASNCASALRAAALISDGAAGTVDAAGAAGGAARKAWILR